MVITHIAIVVDQGASSAGVAVLLIHRDFEAGFGEPGCRCYTASSSTWAEWELACGHAVCAG